MGESEGEGGYGWETVKVREVWMGVKVRVGMDGSEGEGGVWMGESEGEGGYGWERVKVREGMDGRE